MLLISISIYISALNLYTFYVHVKYYVSLSNNSNKMMSWLSGSKVALLCGWQLAPPCALRATSMDLASVMLPSATRSPCTTAAQRNATVGSRYIRNQYMRVSLVYIIYLFFSYSCCVLFLVPVIVLLLCRLLVCILLIPCRLLFLFSFLFSWCIIYCFTDQHIAFELCVYQCKTLLCQNGYSFAAL